MLALRTSPAGFPMSPSVDEWETLTPAERNTVVAALPGEVTDAGTALLLESEELVARLQEMYDDAQRRADEEAQRREEETARREEETRHREEETRRREEA